MAARVLKEMNNGPKIHLKGLLYKFKWARKVKTYFKPPGLVRTPFFAKELCNPTKFDILHALVKLDFPSKVI